MPDLSINRYNKTLIFIRQHITGKKVLDLGTPNCFSRIMENEDYQVYNTHDEDLDLHLLTINGIHSTECLYYSNYQQTN